MENWRKFQEQEEEAAETPETPRIKDYDLTPEQIKKLMSMIQSVYNERYGTVDEQYKFDPSNMEKMASDASSSRRELDAKVDKVGDVIAQDPDRFLDGAQSIKDVESRIEAVAEEMYGIPGLSVEDLNRVYAKLRDHFGFDLDDADPDEFPLEEEEVLKFLSEEIDRMISEGLLDEGLADFAKNIGSKARMGMAGLGMMAAAGGIPSTAQAEISPSQAATQISQVINKKIKKQGLEDYHNLEVKVSDSDAGIKKLAKSVSELTKTLGTDAKGDKEIVDLVTNKVIKVTSKVGDEGNITNNDAVNQAAEEMAGQVDKIKARNDNASDSKKVVKGTQVNYEGAVVNAYNGMQLAYAKNDDAAGKKAVDNLFDILDAAEKAGALDGKAAQAKKLLGKGDIEGFKKLMGY